MNRPSVAPRNRLVRDFKQQAATCREDSALYEALCLGLARAIASPGFPIGKLLGIGLASGTDVPIAFPLLVLGALHDRVLVGKAPDLARYYPSVGGAFVRQDAEGLVRAALATLYEQSEAILDFLRKRHVQTNEVARGSVLLLGMLEAQRRLERPLYLLELGCSAGLNLWLDRYRYAYASPEGELGWGEGDGPLLHCTLKTSEANRMAIAGLLSSKLAVVGRHGVDRAPLDLGNPDEGRVLEAFIWPDQVERLDRLRRARAIVAQTPCSVHQAELPTQAGDALQGAVARLPENAALVVFHSVLAYYLSSGQRSDLDRIIADSAERLHPGQAMARLQFEQSDARKPFELTLDLYERAAWTHASLGQTHHHGRWVEWNPER